MQSGVCCVKRDSSLWREVSLVYSVFYYTTQAGKEVKIQNRFDFIVIVF